jgi:TatD DNase family protein
MLIDTHLHLADSKFDSDRPAVFDRAWMAGVRAWVEIAESPDGWDAAAELAATHSHIYASFGIHPHHAHRYGPSDWKELERRLRRLLEHPKAVAIGEFGLDYFRMQNTKEQQDFLFRSQLTLARELKKPVVIHCREGERSEGFSAHEDIQKALREFYPDTSSAMDCSAPNGVIHCFSGLWKDAQIYFRHGFMAGVDAPITYPSSKILRENVQRMPLERIVLETDSPYLPPQGYRGQRNEPSYLPVVAESIAELKHTTAEQVAAQTSRNAQALFRLPMGDTSGSLPT